MILLDGRVSQAVIVYGSTDNSSSGGAGLGGGGRLTIPGGGGSMAGSASGGWFSMRRDDRDSGELSLKSAKRDTAWFRERFREFSRTCDAKKRSSEKSGECSEESVTTL